MEQPMMRNEHIVRAHQTPVVAINPVNGTPWRFYHVDNTAAAGGDGTAARPFATLDEAATRPINAPYDIVYVHRGASTAATPYVTASDGFMFGASNQYLVGEGSTLAIPAASCGLITPFVTANNRLTPFISNPLGAAIVINEANTTVDHIGITESRIGISDGGSNAGSGVVTNVSIDGGGQFRRGIDITTSTGPFTFQNVSLSNLRDNGLVVSAPNALVNLNDASIRNIEASALLASGDAAAIKASRVTITQVTGTAAVHASGARASISLANSTLSDVRGPQGNAVVASGPASRVDVLSSTISAATGAGVLATGTGGATVAVSDSALLGNNIGAVLSGTSNRLELSRSTIRASTGNGITVAGSRNELMVQNKSKIDGSGANGIFVEGSTQRIRVYDSTISNSAADGFSIATTPNAAGPTIATLLRSEIAGAPAGYGLRAEGVNGAGEVVQIFGSNISGALLGGVFATNSNLDVGVDPTSSSGQVTRISSTGVFGIASVATAGEVFVRVREASITGVTDGIRAVSQGAGVVTNFIALQNGINAPTAGSGILFSEEDSSEIKADVVLNRSLGTNRLEITSEEGNVEIAASSATNLSNINFQAVIIGPGPLPAGYTFNPTLVVPPPPEPSP
jgi:hypothetical protein